MSTSCSHTSVAEPISCHVIEPYTRGMIPPVTLITLYHLPSIIRYVTHTEQLHWLYMKNRSVWRNHSAGKWLQCPLLQLFQQQWLDHCWRISQNCVILSKTQSNSKHNCKQSTISVICLMLYMHVTYCQFISEAMQTSCQHILQWNVCFIPLRIDALAQTGHEIHAQQTRKTPRVTPGTGYLPPQHNTLHSHSPSHCISLSLIFQLRNHLI